MIVSAYSERVYKKNVDAAFIDQMLCALNDAKISVYSKLMHSKIDPEHLNTAFIAAEYNINSFYGNMVLRNAKAVVKSNKELKEINVDTAQENISKKLKQINNNLKALLNLKKLKESCVKLSAAKPCKKEYIKPYQFAQEDDGIVVTNVLNKRKWTLYEFECYIDLRMRRTRHTLYVLRNKLNSLRQKLLWLNTHDYVSCFGSKSLFKKQYTKYLDDHAMWYDKWNKKRHSGFIITGCAKKWHGGNQCVAYDFEKKELSIKEFISKSAQQGEKPSYESVKIPCEFVYQKELYEQAYTNRDCIAYRIADKGEYYIITATFEVPCFDSCTNYSMSDGTVGIDINVDNFSVCDIDSKGNYLGSKVIRFDLRNKRTEQAQKLIEAAVCEVYKYCDNRHKPLVHEDIRKIKFKAEDDTKTNRTLSQFAYNKMINAIDRKFFKGNIDVVKTDPKYTSQQGKLKYMRRYGLSVHQSASLCIARRGLLSKPDKLYYEHLGKYSHFGTIKEIAKEFKKLKFNDFYTIDKDGFLVQPQKYEKAGKYIKDVKDTLLIF